LLAGCDVCHFFLEILRRSSRRGAKIAEDAKKEGHRTEHTEVSHGAYRGTEDTGKEGILNFPVCPVRGLFGLWNDGAKYIAPFAGEDEGMRRTAGHRVAACEVFDTGEGGIADGPHHHGAVVAFGLGAVAGVVARHALARRVRAEGGCVIGRLVLERGHERGGFLRGDVRPGRRQRGPRLRCVGRVRRIPRGLALHVRDEVLEPVVELGVGAGNVPTPSSCCLCHNNLLFIFPVPVPGFSVLVPELSGCFPKNGSSYRFGG